MGGALAIIESMMVNRLLSNDPPLSGKSKAGLGLFTVAGLLLAVAMGFFIVAAYLWLQNNYPPDAAAAIAGLLTLMTALICAGVAYGVLQYKRHRLQKFKDEMIDTMQNALDFAEEELSQPIRDNPKTSVFIASLAGYLAGEKLI
ncbi:MAG: phage holin family protein [Bdellovibrionales bacterium]